MSNENILGASTLSDKKSSSNCDIDSRGCRMPSQPTIPPMPPCKPPKKK